MEKINSNTVVINTRILTKSLFKYSILLIAKKI